MNEQTNPKLHEGQSQVQGGDELVGALLARAAELVEDQSLAAVARWKQAHPGGLAIGTLPVYAPRPLFEAQGCLPVALWGGGDQIDIVRGDSYFQSYVCHLPRSTVELGLTGKLDLLDGMIFPSTCDVIRNLGGMWKLLFPQVYGSYLDLPQNFDPEIGGRFYAGELRRIATELEARGARPLTDLALRDAILAENRRTSLLAQIEALRHKEPWRIPASDAYLIVRAGSVLPAGDHISLLERFLVAVQQRPARPYDNVRIVVRGSFCEQPPHTLLRALEKAGCDIIDDDLLVALGALRGPISLPEDPAEGGALEALALAYLQLGRASSCRYIGDDVKGRSLIEAVRDSSADGVIFAAPSFCDPALLDQPMLERALDRAGIPHTSFKYSENSGQFHAIREQAGAFSDSVKLWGAA